MRSKYQRKGLQKKGLYKSHMLSVSGSKSFFNANFLIHSWYWLTKHNFLCFRLWSWLIDNDWERNHMILTLVNFFCWTFKLLNINILLRKEPVPGTSTTLVGGFEDKVLICRVEKTTVHKTSYDQTNIFTQRSFSSKRFAEINRKEAMCQKPHY